MKTKAWVAIFALLVQALLPAAVRAAAPQDTYFAEICTAFGIKKAVSHETGDMGGAFHEQHCPVCAVAHLSALPTSHAELHLPVGVVCVSVLPAGGRKYPPAPLPLYLRGPPAGA